MNPNLCHIKTYNMPIFISFEQVGGGGGGGLVEAKPIDASGKTAATTSYSGDIVNHYTYQVRKLGKKVYNSQHTLTVDEEYYDELMFSFGVPARISHGDGYVTLNKSGHAESFYFYLKDHLGNVRSVILPDASNQPVVSQANDYFPFGMSFESTLPNPGIRANYNKLKYNGKEEQEMPGKWLDYGARFYDTQLGRFHSVDRYAEMYSALSPYGYVAGNPIKNFDVNGDFIGTVIGAVVGGAAGAYDSYKNGGDVWAGAAEGAVSGAIAGAAVDLAVAATVATGGGALVVIGAGAVAGAIGGAAGAVTGDATGQVVTSLKDGSSMSDAVSSINMDNMLDKAKTGAITGLIGGATGGAVGKGLQAATNSTKAVQGTMSKKITETAKTLTKMGADEKTVGNAVNKITSGMGEAGRNTVNTTNKVASGTGMVAESSIRTWQIKNEEK